jgi:uncharacterized protein (DUF697 family)
VPSWNDLGTAFNTLRELDVTVIREESERQLHIACLGPRQLFGQAYALLRGHGSARYGPVGRDPLSYQALPQGAPDDTLRRADLLLILVDARRPLPQSDAGALVRLGELALPTVIAICGASSPGELGQPRPEFAQARIVVLPNLGAPEAGATLAAAILERLPAELHLAAARALPGLREVYGRDLTNSVAFSNATYALASSLPSQIPILAVPFAAADILVLTKNQALMVYRLALANGAPPEFQSRMAEIAPVIGGAFVWRQVARSLVGLIPIWGIVPKVAVAYAGTFTTGSAAVAWYTDGEALSPQRLRQLADEGMRIGRERARILAEAAREKGKDAGDRLRLLRPGKGKKEE